VKKAYTAEMGFHALNSEVIKLKEHAKKKNEEVKIQEEPLK